MEISKEEFLYLVANDAFRVWLLKGYTQKDIGKALGRSADWVRDRQK